VSRPYTRSGTPHHVSRPSRALYALAGLGLAALAVEAVAVRRVRRRPLAPATSHPGVSVLKPLAGDDPELEADLESHAALDYPGQWEIVLGLEDEADAAAPAARAFVARHPERARFVVAGGRAGRHPKVNQVIFLTRAARHDVLVVTDANARVAPGHLREVAAALERPGVGLATSLVAARGERHAGAAVDNQTWLAFVVPNVAMATVLGIEQVVGKSLGIRRAVLERIGGWEAVKDVLGDDKALGDLIADAGLRSYVCPTPVGHVQAGQGFAVHWARQTRWAAIRFRLLRPGFFLEPLLNPVALSGAALALSPRSRRAGLLTAATWIASAGLCQLFARIVRGHGFAARHLALFPLAQLLLFAAWARGATVRHVTWHGRRYALGPDTRLGPPVAVARASHGSRRLGILRRDRGAIRPPEEPT
jgi:ceramide glucosyltransferase